MDELFDVVSDGDEVVGRATRKEAGIRAEPVFLGAFQKRFDEKDKENVRVYGFVAGQALAVDPGELEEKIRSEKFLPETGVLCNILKEYYRKGGAGA